MASANVDISYIGIGKISVKILRYQQKCQISVKMPDIVKMKISVLVTNMLAGANILVPAGPISV